MDTEMKTLEEQYPWVAKWESHMRSFSYLPRALGYRNEQLLKAARDKAPQNAIYFCHSENRWHTTDDITNPYLIQLWGLSR